MKLLTTANQLLSIYSQMKKFEPSIDPNSYQVKMFDQLWASTALGFGGCGGSMMTTATTFVIYKPFDIYYNGINKVWVFFGDEFAYRIENPNEEFWDDVNDHRMASVASRYKYYKKESED